MFVLAGSPPTFHEQMDGRHDARGGVPHAKQTLRRSAAAQLLRPRRAEQAESDEGA